MHFLWFISAGFSRIHAESGNMNQHREMKIFTTHELISRKSVRNVKTESPFVTSRKKLYLSNQTKTMKTKQMTLIS